MNAPRKILIVDGASLAYTAYFSFDAKGIAVNRVIYGFFMLLLQACRNREAHHICFCWDSSKSLRKRIFPGYKGNRKGSETRTFVQSQLERLRDEIIPVLGFVNSFQRVGYEADDLIASICRHPGPEEGEEYTVVSSDHDMYQLLTDSVSMYDVRRRSIYTRRDFMEEYGIEPILWGSVKAMAGCSTDKVPGVPGVGERKAIKYISGELEWKRSEEAQAIIERNQKLVVLPFFGTPKYKLLWDGQLNYEAFTMYCNVFGFPKLAKQKDWKRLFSGSTPLSLKSKLFRIRRNRNM